MKFLVLASNSFTGAHFVNHLLENTEHEVIGISRSPEYHPLMLPYLYQKERSPRFCFHQLNLNTDLNKIIDLVDHKKPEYIINLAAQGEVRNSWQWPAHWYETNVMAVVKFSSALVDKKFIKKYVVPSTPEVYGSTSPNLSESESYRPSTPYAVSKLAGDLHLLALHKRYGFPVNFTRAANLYGIHQQLYRIIPRTILYIKKNKTLELHGEGKSIRSFIHARDVADATYKVAMTEHTGEVYHIAPQDAGISMFHLVQKICKFLNVDMSQRVKLIQENFGQDSLFSLNSEKIRTQLHWQDRVSLDSGIQEMITWIETNWEQIKDFPDEYQHQP